MAKTAAGVFEHYIKPQNVQKFLTVDTDWTQSLHLNRCHILWQKVAFLSLNVCWGYAPLFSMIFTPWLQRRSGKRKNAAFYFGDAENGRNENTRHENAAPQCVA